MDFTILNQINDPIYIIDFESYNIIYINDAMLKKFNLTKEIIGKPCYQVLNNKNELCNHCANNKLFQQIKKYSMIKNKSNHNIHSYDLEIDGNKYQLKWLTDNPNNSAATINLDSQYHIVDCIHHLVAAKNFDESVDTLLNTIVKYYNGDRGYIFEFNWEENYAKNTYEFCRDESISPEINHLQKVPLEVMCFWIDSFKTNNFVCIEDVEKIKVTRPDEYAVLSAQGIKGLLAVPFYEDEQLKGFLGVDDPKQNSFDNYFLENLTYFISVEITNHHLQNELEILSYRDALTNLRNRNSFNLYNKNLEIRKPNNVGICFIDINGLKQMNDTYGHDYGDIVIKYVAKEIKKHFIDDYVFRISGDEFVLICENITYQDFKDKVHKMEIALAEDDRKVISCGYVWEDSINKIQDALKKADDLMYINKKNYYKKHLDIYTNKSEVLQKLLQSLLNKEYTIYLQPKYDLKSNVIDGAEVLVRYIDINGKVVSPVNFIPLLEKEKIVSYIDYFVLKKTCALLKKWKDDNQPPILLSLNFSKITLFEDDFIYKVISICNEYDIQYHELEFEITETQESFDKRQMSNLIEKLSAAGFLISLDDFGVGFSSYEFLTQCHFDSVKIDRSLTSRISNNPSGLIIVKSIIDLCQQLNCKSIAEGVETIEEFNLLKEANCKSIQGYFINRPIAVDVFENLYLQETKV